MARKFGVSFLLVGTILCCGIVFADSSLSTYSGCTLIESPVNDGDSFMVNIGDSVIHLRIYFADCPEKTVTQDHDVRRVKEQAGYFGLEEPGLVKELGALAADFTKSVLSHPFTVHTAHAKALGGRSSQRVYGFVVTADGRDLAELLVEQGLARNFGVSRQNYRGESLQAVEGKLAEIEGNAKLARRGAWERSDEHIISSYRETQRQEKEQARLLMSSVISSLDQPLDINSADQKKLEKLPGIGPVIAARIVQNRPYRSADDLKKVHGIGDKTLDEILPFIRFGETPSVNG